MPLCNPNVIKVDYNKKIKKKTKKATHWKISISFADVLSCIFECSKKSSPRLFRIGQIKNNQLSRVAKQLPFIWKLKLYLRVVFMSLKLRIIK